MSFMFAKRVEEWEKRYKCLPNYLVKKTGDAIDIKYTQRENKAKSNKKNGTCVHKCSHALMQYSGNMQTSGNGNDLDCHWILFGVLFYGL